MRTIAILTTAILIFSLQILPAKAIAQGTSIRYSIPNLASPPAAGSSSQLRGSIEYDDTTLVVAHFSFDVPLFSFISDFGTYNYIAAIGAASTFPYLRFESSKIEQEGENLVMKGALEYRGMNRPVTIAAKRIDAKNEFYVEGDFTVNIRDYFMFSSGFGLPSYMNIEFRMVFDKSEPIEE